MKLSTKFLGTGPLPREVLMCLLKQIFKGGFLTFKKHHQQPLFPIPKAYCIKRRIVPKYAVILVECAGCWRNLVFSSFFFRPTSSCRHHVFFYLYSKCLLCLSGRSEDTWVINSSSPLSSLDLSTFLFLSFLDFFPVTFRPIFVNPTRDFPLLSFNVAEAAFSF